jgi:Spy/CpxP family protein refolding chaperone
MVTAMKRTLVLAAALLSSAPLLAQTPQRGAAGAGRGADAVAAQEASITPAEIQRMFDAYALLQAQEQLKIGDEQYTQFLTRFKALQDVRRKALNERSRIVQDLRKLINDGQPDEAQIKERLKTLDDVEARAAADSKKAYDAIDQVLDVRQQARFRIFEEVMERRKLELVTRARLANRPKP